MFTFQKNVLQSIFVFGFLLKELREFDVNFWTGKNKTVFDVPEKTFLGKAFFSKQKNSSCTIVGLWNLNDSEFCQKCDKDAITEHWMSSEIFIWNQFFY